MENIAVLHAKARAKRLKSIATAGMRLAAGISDLTLTNKPALEQCIRTNFSFSPGFSLGSERDLNVDNRFNGL
jgi:hypothetical protein